MDSRKSCCLRVPSSLALHTTLGLPGSTYMMVKNKQLKMEDTKKLIKKRGLTASFFTLRVWHWYIADGVRALSSSALPLNPARLNSLTYIIYDKDTSQ